MTRDEARTWLAETCGTPGMGGARHQIKGLVKLAEWDGEAAEESIRIATPHAKAVQKSNAKAAAKARRRESAQARTDAESANYELDEIERRE